MDNLKPHKGVIDDWMYVGNSKSKRILGDFCSHPEYAGRRVTTSRVVCIDGNEVETENSRYTLGTRMRASMPDKDLAVKPHPAKTGKNAKQMSRTAKWEAKRRSMGWKEVRVWVPSAADRDFIRKYASSKRKAALDPKASKHANQPAPAANSKSVPQQGD